MIQSSFAFTQVQNTGLAYALGKVDKNSIEINYMTNICFLSFPILVQVAADFGVLVQAAVFEAR